MSGGQGPASGLYRGLGLLCLLVKSRSGRARALPVHTMHPVPPRAALRGQWALRCYPYLLMRETHARPAAAEVLDRCARQRRGNALRRALGYVRAGHASHAHGV